MFLDLQKMSEYESISARVGSRTRRGLPDSIHDRADCVYLFSFDTQVDPVVIDEEPIHVIVGRSLLFLF